MRVEIKFCGLTRPEDARHAGVLGAAYAGVVFAGGPRRIDAALASNVLAAAGDGVQRVGVFADEPADEVARVAAIAGLHVVQLHGTATAGADRVGRIRSETGARIWAVVHVSGHPAGPGPGPDIAERIAELDAVADAILLDSLVPGRLGGSGVRFDWRLLTPEARPSRARLVAAGGLDIQNVGDAIRTLAPDVVDVSSGVESSPGIKDHERMRAFVNAVRRQCEEP